MSTCRRSRHSVLLFKELLHSKYTCSHTHLDKLPFLANVSQSFVSNCKENKTSIILFSFHLKAFPLAICTGWNQMGALRKAGHEVECDQQTFPSLWPLHSSFFFWPGTCSADPTELVQKPFEHTFFSNQKAYNWRLNLSPRLMYCFCFVLF